MSDRPVIHWFRRDLRLQDNLALNAAIDTGQPVIPLFILDPVILNSPRMSAVRLKFMLAALRSLDEQLRKYQARLIVRWGEPTVALQGLIEETGATALHFNRDYTPYARQRDAMLHSYLPIPVNTFHDRLLAVPGDIVKKDGSPFVVYTPFRNRWRSLPKEELTEMNLSHIRWFITTSQELPDLEAFGLASTIMLPAASESAAIQRLSSFISNNIYAYSEQRNQLGNAGSEPETGTSFLSPYIRFGMVSPRQIYWKARAAYDQSQSPAEQKGVEVFIDEIIWHEFYTHILWFFPHVKSQNFNRQYDNIKWQSSERLLKAWKAGRTGYPIVDAAMRQLSRTGWMHNRARMIVASFLTKDLLIDWREGELFFMQCLIDGDLAANNGGWQWTASTGTDAQPYYRIFNPVSQSQKFDTDGAFIRHWIPELRDVPDAFIHEPWTMRTPPAHYPKPIVNHAQARDKALTTYKEARS